MINFIVHEVRKTQPIKGALSRQYEATINQPHLVIFFLIKHIDQCLGLDEHVHHDQVQVPKPCWHGAKGLSARVTSMLYSRKLNQFKSSNESPSNYQFQRSQSRRCTYSI